MPDPLFLPRFMRFIPEGGKTRLVRDTPGSLVAVLRWLALKMNMIKVRKFLFYFQKKKNFTKGQKPRK